MKSFFAPIIVSAALSASPLLAGAAEPTTGPITFQASVLVDVDSNGKPVKVEAPQDLPESIRNFIEQRVASWQYQPGKIDGIPQSATTYVSVNACAVPVTGGYKMGLDYDGNGPRIVSDRRLKPPAYPHSARRAGTEAEFDLIIHVGTDGHVKSSSVEKSEFRGRAGSSDFEPLMRGWVRTLRFDVEQFAGKPVSSQVRITVEFVSGARINRKALVDEFLAKASASRECQMATGGNDMKPIGMDSVLKVTPIPAG